MLRFFANVVVSTGIFFKHEWEKYENWHFESVSEQVQNRSSFQIEFWRFVDHMQKDDKEDVEPEIRQIKITHNYVVAAVESSASFIQIEHNDKYWSTFPTDFFVDVKYLNFIKDTYI